MAIQEVFLTMLSPSEPAAGHDVSGSIPFRVTTVSEGGTMGNVQTLSMVNDWPCYSTWKSILGILAH